jgi:hypothetical protein
MVADDDTEARLEDHEDCIASLFRGGKITYLGLFVAFMAVALVGLGSLLGQMRDHDRIEKLEQRCASLECAVEDALRSTVGRFDKVSDLSEENAVKHDIAWNRMDATYEVLEDTRDKLQRVRK